MTEYLEIIKQHIVKNERIEIKSYLENLSETIKGKVFEHFISELYIGNGWLAEIKGTRDDKGADIIVRHPSEPAKVKFIIQAKNHKSRLNKKNTLSELNQFKEEASKLYNCKQYRLISINGFVADSFLYEKYNLRLESWEHIEKLLDNYKKDRHEAPEIGLHSHNKATYNKTIDLWKNHKRVAIIQATGTGKSYIIFKTLSDFQGKKKILITPSNVIRNQFKENTDYGWLIDESVNSFLYQNRTNFSESNITKLKADLIVLDEFHRIGAKKWEKKIERLLELNPNSFVLGTSATPIRFLDGKRDMAEEFFFGIKAAELALPQAIVKQIIPNPTYIASLISLYEEVENMKLEIEKSRLTLEEKEKIRNELEQRQLDWEKSKGVPEILNKHLSGKNLKKFVVFCEGIEHLDKMEIEVEGWFQKAGFRNRSKYRVHSKQSEKENKKIIKNFQRQNNISVSLLFAIDMLNEGMHIESIDGVILLRPTESPIIFYQQIGRCLQVGNNNPIIFDLVNNFSSIRANNFINDLNEAKKQEQKQLQEDGVIDDIPDFKVTDETKEIVELLDSIGNQLNTWEIWYGLLSEYHKLNNNSCPKHTEKFNGENIGYWVGEQRRKKDKLSIIQIQKLNDIDFDWGEDRKMSILDRCQNQRRYVKMLEDYYNEHKNCKVPKREPKSETSKKFWSKELSIWFHHSLKPKLFQEFEKNQTYFTYEYNGEIISIFDFLNIIGIKKAFKKRNIDIAFERLEKELEKNPLFNSSDFEDIINTDKDFYKYVVCKVRGYYHEHGVGSNTFTGRQYFQEGEIEKLESLGFTWYTRPPKTWDEQFKELEEIKKRTGHINFKTKENPSLFQWCRTQRNNKDKLEPYQIEKLNSLGFLWVIKRVKSSPRLKNNLNFEENAKQLFRYKDDNGNFKFTSKDKISQWIRTLRMRGTTPERKEILKKYGYDLDAELKKSNKKMPGGNKL